MRSLRALREAALFSLPLTNPCDSGTFDTVTLYPPFTARPGYLHYEFSSSGSFGLAPPSSIPSPRHPTVVAALTGSRDRSLQIWDLRTGDLLRTLVGHTDAVYAVAVSPDDHFALSGSADRTVRFWSMETGELVHSFTDHAGPVTVVAICPDGRHGLSGSRDRTLRLWDLQERVCRATVPLEAAPLAFAVAADSRTAVVGDRVGNVHCFELAGV